MLNITTDNRGRVHAEIQSVFGRLSFLRYEDGSVSIEGKDEYHSLNAEEWQKLASAFHALDQHN